MVEFTRCPKCQTLYELDGIDLEVSSGWVQCGDCDRKFKAINHAVEPDEISFLTVSNYDYEQSMKMEGAVSEDLVESSMHIVDNVVAEKKHDDIETQRQQQKNINYAEYGQENVQPEFQQNQTASFNERANSNDEYELTINVSSDGLSSQEQQANLNQFITPSEESTQATHHSEQKQLSEQLYSSDSEFLEKTIILPNEVSSTEDEDENYEFIFNNYSEDIFDPALIDEEQENVDSSINKRLKKNTYAELHSEFSEEEIEIETEFPEKTILEEALENSTVSHSVDETESILHTRSTIYGEKTTGKLLNFLGSAFASIIMFSLMGVLALQIHSRGTYQWIPQSAYDQVIRQAPFLANFEKSQIDLSAIHLASTRMEANPENPSSRIITLQLINRSYSNQAYPDFQLEFTDAQGATIARRIILPSVYLQQGHLGLLEPRQAKIVYLNLKSLHLEAVGYQIKVVQQNSV